jgi:hypothetical protein
LIAGKLEESFVEKVRFEVAVQACRSIVGLTIETIVELLQPFSYRTDGLKIVSTS